MNILISFIFWVPGGWLMGFFVGYVVKTIIMVVDGDMDADPTPFAKKSGYVMLTIGSIVWLIEKPLWG